MVVGPDTSRSNGVIWTGGRHPRLHSSHSPFQLGGIQGRYCVTLFLNQSHSPANHGLHSHFSPLLPPSLSSFLFTLRSAHFGSLWASFSTFTAFLFGWRLNRTQAPSKILALSVTAAWILAGWCSYAQCTTNDVTIAALEFVLQTTDASHHGAAQYVPSQYQLQHPIMSRSALTWSSNRYSPARTSTTTTWPVFERGLFLQLNCHGLKHCHAEL